MPDSAEEHVSCRICMDPKDSYVSLFSHNLSMKVMEVADVQVEKDDGLPSSICTECEQDLEKCYEFRLKVQVSDKKLRENIKLTQVDIVECNIKEERYMDDGDSDNLEDKDSGSMDDEHYDDEPDVAPRISEETEEAEPDPLNHVVVVEENERKMEMTEEPSTQDDMVEEPQVQKIEEVALDPLVCMKQEAETEIMDVDSNMPDPFGPSSSVRSTEPPFFIPSMSTTSTVEGNVIDKGINQYPLSETIKTWPASMLDSSTNNSYNNNTGNLLPASTSQDINTFGHFNKEQSFLALPLQAGISQGSFSEVSSFPPLPLPFGNTQGQFYTGQLLPPSPLQPGSSQDNLYISQHFLYQFGRAQGHFNVENPQQLPTNSIFVADLAPNVQNNSINFPPSNIDSQINSELISNIGQVYVQNVTTGAQRKRKSSNSKRNAKNRSQVKNKINLLAVAAEEEQSNNSDTRIITTALGSKKTSLPDIQVGKENDSDLRSTLSQKNTENVESINECFCLVCNVNFGSPDLLEDHTTGRKNFVCRACTAIFNNHKELEAHFFSHKRLSCKICKQVFYVKNDLVLHRKKVLKCKFPESLKCTLCKNTFVHQENFQIHMKRKHGINDTQEVTCNICNSSHKNQSHFTNHLRLCHTAYENMECDICHVVLLGPKRLKAHIKGMHLNGVLISCPICNKVLSSPESLRNHMDIHDNAESPCTICGVLIKGKGVYFRDHMRSHQKKIFNCNHCSQTFNSFSDKRKHTRKVHLQEKKYDKPSVCEICGKEYKSRQVLKNHMVIHSDEKPYVCEICGAAFKVQVALRTHSRIHSNLSKYSCNHCGKGFKWKQTFDKHLLKCESSQNNDTHTQELK